MNTPVVQLIDAGTGNLQSVFNALQYLGAEIRLVNNGVDCYKDMKTILPGVGAFRMFMEGMYTRNLANSILETARLGIPMLGICVGMQAMFETSEEMGETPGLGIIPGVVRRFPEQNDFKVPHTGWNEITFDGSPSLFRGIEPGSYFYFNHSYYCQSESANNTLANTNYILPFSSAVVSGNIFGVQFHPEKSQKLGQQLLRNFLDL
jgi:imidazole glycerol-phosphate synthase subunit HisH